MNIGQVSKNSGVTAKSIRYYESIGLLPEPARSESGYRQYTKSDVQVLHFVHRARNLGFAIKDVSNLLSLWHDKNRASADVKALAAEHIREVEMRIIQLQEMRDTLAELVDKCHGDDRPDCPILDNFAGDEDVNPKES